MTQKKTKVSINNIAQKLNVSVSTVSRALNNHPKISDETKADVMRVAQQLGYKPKMPEAFAPSPKRKKSGVVVPHLDKSIYVHVLKGVEQLASDNQMSVVVSMSGNNISKELEILDAFEEMMVDGLLISLAVNTKSAPKIAELAEKGTKVVCYNRVSDQIMGGKVLVDNYHGAYLATEHLLNNKSKRIAYLSGARDCPIYSERVKAYCDAIAQKGLKIDDDIVMRSELTTKDIHQFLEYAFSLPNPPDALLVNDNIQALQSMSFLRNLGFVVPTDVAIVSFGAEEFNNYLTPSITCVEFSGYSLGKKAANLLIKEIHSPDKQANLTLIETSKLVIRNTSIRH